MRAPIVLLDSKSYQLPIEAAGVSPKTANAPINLLRCILKTSVKMFTVRTMFLRVRRQIDLELGAVVSGETVKAERQGNIMHFFKKMQAKNFIRFDSHRPRWQRLLPSR
jgi:hypothetical protein